MKTKFAIGIFTTILAVLLVGSAAALPVLTVSNPQSNANYQLDVAVHTLQSCTATPSEYIGRACGTGNSQAFVTVSDDGQCSSSSDQSCRFSPSNVTVNVGGSVAWQNVGRLNHTVVSDPSSLVSFSLTLRPFFFQQSVTFSTAGTFMYHDNLYPWMTGVVVVSQPIIPPPKIQVFTVSGPVGWTVTGLDSQKALLSITHELKVYNASSIPQKLLVSESGVVEDSIVLSTREESIDISRILFAIPYLYNYIYGYPVGYGGPPSPLIGSGGSFSGPSGSSIVPYFPYFYQPPKLYTAWWVNGPLSLGTIVQIQTLTGSVRGSESVSLGGSLGSRDAWIVGSQYREQYSQAPPPVTPGNYPTYFVANQSVSTSQQFDYGKQSDLLFKSSDSIDQYSQISTVFPPGSILYGFGGFFGGFSSGGTPLDETVTVTRTQDTNLSITLNLLSTNINLGRNTAPPSGQGSNNLLQSAMLPVLTATGIAAASMVGGAVWLIRRSQRKGPIELETLTPPSPQTPT